MYLWWMYIFTFVNVHSYNHLNKMLCPFPYFDTTGMSIFWENKKKNILCYLFFWDYNIFFFNHDSHMDTGALTHWGRVTHMCLSKLTILGSDNGLSPGRLQATIWTNAAILLIGTLGTNFIEILIGIQTFSFKKMLLKMSSVKWRPSCLGLNMSIDMLSVCFITRPIGHRGEVMYISLIDFQWTSTETKTFSIG